MKRRTFLAGWREPRPPNLLLITADNLGYGDLGPAIHSPQLDRFRREGMRLTNFYTSSPTCTASRAGLLTGRHPLRYGLNYQLSAAENKTGIGLPHGERLMPAYLRERGYATGCFGKWNLGFAPGSRPTERGFDEFFGHRSGNIDYYTHIYNGELDLYRGTEPARVNGYSTDLFADAAIDFIRRKREQPFFCYLPFNAPHFPNPANARPGETNEWQAPAEAFAAYGVSPEVKDPRVRYRAVVTALDTAFGRVMRALEDAGQAERTLVFFYSDNGAFMLPGRGLEVQTNHPLRDGGVTCREGGIRVLAMARWPGRIRAGAASGALVSAHDLLPLALGLAGAGRPADRVLDGRDPRGVLEGRDRRGHARLGFEFTRQQALREGKWKLFREKPEAAWELYDLERDIGEARDVAREQSAVVRRLGQAFEGWRREVAGP